MKAFDVQSSIAVTSFVVIMCGNFVRDYYVVVVQLELHTDTRTGIPQTLSSLSSLCTRSVVARAQV